MMRSPEPPHYLRMLGFTIGGWLLGREVLALGEREGEDSGWVDAKMATFSFYATQLLPQVTGLTPFSGCRGRSAVRDRAQVLGRRVTGRPAMQLTGAVAVVTGGGGGIGAALVRRFASEGAAGIVVGDIDIAAADALAKDVGPAVLAVEADAAIEEDTVRLLETAEERFGPVDLFCANAGIFTPGGPEVADEAWDRIWRVNVLSHVHAARHYVPRVVARGQRLPAAHRIRRRAALQPRRCPLCGHQARRSGAGGVVVDHIRRPGA